MRVLLVGAGGMLATDLVKTQPADVELDARDLHQLDITNAESIAASVADVRPDWILNASGYTAVDRAEIERDLANAINGIGPGLLGAAAKRAGARVAHISTDYVFAGDATRPYREDDPVGPISVYGATKLAGEARLLYSGAQSLIVRTQWLFGVHGSSFPRTMLGRVQRKEPTSVVNDQHGRLTYTRDLAAVLWKLMQSGADGIYHAANAGAITWYDVARWIFEREGVPHLLTPCTTAEFPRQAKRPQYGVLDTTKLERLLGGPLPSWKDALERFSEEANRNNTGTRLDRNE